MFKILLSASCVKYNYLSPLPHWETINITVSGPPDPPYDVRLNSCSQQYAEVAWNPGTENNDPITGYIVEYNTSFDEHGKFHECAKVPKANTSAKIRVLPWTNYTFSVKASNGLDFSERSAFTSEVCTTTSAKPYRNPTKVCSQPGDTNELVVIWEVSSCAN